MAEGRAGPFEKEGVFRTDLELDFGFAGGAARVIVLLL
jgi:hypothetical protein